MVINYFIRDTCVRLFLCVPSSRVLSDLSAVLGLPPTACMCDHIRVAYNQLQLQLQLIQYLLLASQTLAHT